MAKPRQNNDYVVTETARRIRDLRQQRGLTRTQLADAAGLHEHALEKIEGEGTDMHITTLITIAGALNVAPSRLLPDPRRR